MASSRQRLLGLGALLLLAGPLACGGSEGAAGLDAGLDTGAPADGSPGEPGLDAGIEADAGGEAPLELLVEVEIDGHWRLHRVGIDGSDLRPAIAGDARGGEASVRGGRVVFTRVVQGYAAVHAAQLGGEPERLTAAEATEQDPVLSPEGDKLAFVRSVGEIPKLFIANADGTGAVRLTSRFGSADTVEQSPSFSPDGSQVVFSAAVAGLPDLFVVDVASGDVELLLAENDALIEPSWSPGGEAIAFVSGFLDRAEIHVLDLSSGDVAPLTHGPEPSGQPAWLTSGEIVFTSWNNGNSELRLVDPDEPAQVRAIATDGLPARGPAPIR
jgi:hypothetical protein